MISSLGKNLNIHIFCDSVSSHNWMSFVCWKSIFDNLPEANVFVYCKRTKIINSFIWPRKVNVSFKTYSDSNYENLIKSISNNSLIIPPCCVAIRNFEESKIDPNEFLLEKISFLDEKLCCHSKKEDFGVFCDYSEGWGDFNLDKWLNKIETPISDTIIDSLSKKISNPNERHVMNAFKSSVRLFHSISGGKIL